MVLIKIPDGAEKIIKALNSAGEEAYVVGGCVRDAVLGQEPHDWDICTSAVPEKVISLFGKVIPTGLKHGTVTILVDGQGYEVTTYRIDGPYSDGRHPDTISFTAELQQDLSRRDFTMNAIAYSPNTGLIAPHGGMEDIRAGTIKCVGVPDERFAEDPLRVMRAVRFAATLGFRVEPETWAAARRHIPSLSLVSRERVRDELLKLIVGRDVHRVLTNYKDVIAAIIPELRPCFGFQQNNPYHIYDVWEHTVEAVGLVPADPILRMTMLLHDIGKPLCYQTDENGVGHFHGHGKISAGIARDVLSRLRFDNESRDTIVQLVEQHDRFIEMSSRSVRRLLNQVGPEQFDRLMEIRLADIGAQNPEMSQQRYQKVWSLRTVKSRILKQQECFGMKDLAVNGRDMIALGCKPGPMVGNVLGLLLEEVMDDPSKNNRSELLASAKRIIATKCGKQS